MSRVVAVRRTGGFAGMTRSGEVDLDGDDRRGPELAGLVDRVDAAGLAGAGAAGAGRADAFVYDFDLCGATCQVHEQGLTGDLRRIAELLLE